MLQNEINVRHNLCTTLLSFRDPSKGRKKKETKIDIALANLSRLSDQVKHITDRYSSFLCSTRRITQGQPPPALINTCLPLTTHKTTQAAETAIQEVVTTVQGQPVHRLDHRRHYHLCHRHRRRIFTHLLPRHHIIIHRCPLVLHLRRWILYIILLRLVHIHRHHNTRQWD